MELKNAYRFNLGRNKKYFTPAVDSLNQDKKKNTAPNTYSSEREEAWFI